jgi:hypothetical protein
MIRCLQRLNRSISRSVRFDISQSGQCQSEAFQRLLGELGITGSMSSSGDGGVTR